MWKICRKFKGSFEDLQIFLMSRGASTAPIFLLLTRADLMQNLVLGNKVSTSCFIIVACAVLHKVAIIHQSKIVEDIEPVIDNNIPVLPFPAVNEGLGNMMRQNVVNNYFD